MPVVIVVASELHLLVLKFIPNEGFLVLNQSFELHLMVSPTSTPTSSDNLPKVGLMLAIANRNLYFEC